MPKWYKHIVLDISMVWLYNPMLLLLLTWINFVPAVIRNNFRYEVLVKIIYPFPNFDWF